MADIPVKIYKSRKIREGTRPSNPEFPESDPPPVVNPPGSGPSYLSLIDTKDSNYNGKNGFVPIVVNESELQLVPLPQLQENGLISGGIVQWTGSGYVFNGSGAFYRIGGSAYSSPATQLTLSAPDPTDDRIDVFAVDINGEMIVIEGTPAATPVKPQVDPATQLELTSVIVTAASTEPTLLEEILYDDAAIWTGTSGGSGTVNFTSTADPCEGTNSIEVTNAQNGTYIQFDNGSELDISPFQTFGFILKLKSNMPNGQTIALGLYDGSMNAVISPIPLSFDKSSTDCQFVGIVLSGQSFVSLNVRYVRFQFIRFSGSTTYSGFFLDIVKFEGGINPPETSSNHNQLQGLQGGNATERYHSSKDQWDAQEAANAPNASNPFATMADVGGGGITGSGTANEIAYFTGASSIGSLSVMTYPSLAELAHVKGLTSPAQTQLDGKQATIAGTLTNGHVATIVAGVPTWQAPAGGSSNWTVVGSDIYRNSRVLIGASSFVSSGSKLEVSGLISQVGTGRSILIGEDAGRIDDLSNNDNVFIGYRAGYSNIVGQQTVFIGWQAGNLNTASGNTAIGYESLLSNTSGANSTCLGWRSGRAINGAGQITAIGYAAADAVTSGQLGVAIGNDAAGAVQTQNFWTAIGANAGNAITTGGDWVAIGYNSARYVTNGNNSTVIGSSAAFAYTAGGNATSFTNGVYIGYQTRVAAAAATNEIVIGYQAQGLGSNTVVLGNTSIATTYLRGSLNLTDPANIVLGTTTGTKIGTTTSQKLAFWNKTPIIQPTTGITGATLVSNLGTPITATDTFGGYTLQQLAAIIINTGLAA